MSAAVSGLEAAAGQPELGEARERRLRRWVAALALLPTPLWFVGAVLLDRGPAWRAEYHAGQELAGPGAVLSERRLSRQWDRLERDVPGGFDVASFSARFDTCLQLSEQRELPFLLVATGAASFSIDGQEQLRLEASAERRTLGKSIQLAPGTHHLRVEFSARGWSGIGLYASFDGRAPVAVPPERGDAGARWFQARPGAEPCSR
ncbi:MAG TPA: hypothetical protein VFS67_02400 [Polyangiaceae bacterium]|jgi:hypothetical protein|nr:hypothetical protein [Polyangiaceae bacterium]